MCDIAAPFYTKIRFAAKIYKNIFWCYIGSLMSLHSTFLWLNYLSAAQASLSADIYFIHSYCTIVHHYYQ